MSVHDEARGANQTQRFALLEHTTRDGVHWDLLIQAPGQERLLTWRLAVSPIDAGPDGVPAHRIGDHRALYLDFEGELTGGRGSVRRLDGGMAAWLTGSSGTGDCRMRLAGKRLRGDFEITRLAGGERFRPVAE